MTKRNFTSRRDVAETVSAGQAVRAALGLTQQELAWLLGVTRVMLARDEGERRFLPSEATNRLYDILKLVMAPAPAPPGLPPPDAVQREELAHRLHVIGWEEERLREQARRLQARLTQFRRRQQLDAALRALLPAEPDRPHRVLDMLLHQAAGWLALDASAPLLPELRLRVLAFERAEIERLLGGSGAAPDPAGPG